jgi:hypothetical protein
MIRVRIERRGRRLLAVIGTALLLGATFFTHSLLSYFLGSVCFGLIFRQMIEDKLTKK